MWNNPLSCNLYVQSQNKCIFYTELYQGRLWQQITLEKVCVLKYLLYWKVSISSTIYFYDTLRAACLYSSPGWHSHLVALLAPGPGMIVPSVWYSSSFSSELSCHDKTSQYHLVLLPTLFARTFYICHNAQCYSKTWMLNVEFY